MALSCSLMTAAITLDCSNKPVGGLRERVWLINHSEITGTTAASGTYSAIAFASTKTAFKWEAVVGFIKGTYSVITGVISGGWQHQLTLVLPDDTQAGITQMQLMADGRTVGIVEKFQAGDNTFRLYGVTHGMEVPEVAGDEANTENSGLPLITLRTPEGSREPDAPAHFLDTDYDTTVTTLTGYE